MNLSPSEQDKVAAQIANFIRPNTINYGAVATRVGAAGYPEAAIVAITETGRTDCTAKVAAYSNRIVYASRTGTHVSYPIRREDAGHIVAGFLSMEGD